MNRLDYTASAMARKRQIKNKRKLVKAILELNISEDEKTELIKLTKRL